VLFGGIHALINPVKPVISLSSYIIFKNKFLHIMKKSLTIFLCSILFFIFLTEGFSQITSRKSGNWNSASTWNGGSVPTSSDAVIISDGHTVTINANAVCRNITIGQGGTGSATLNFDGSARTLTVSGTVTGYVYISSNGVLEATNGINQTINVAGDFTNLGTFTQGTNNTVVFTGTTARSIIGSNIVFNNLTINNSGGVILSTDITVNNTLTLTSGLLYTSNDTLTVNGNISVTSPGSTKMIVLDDGTGFGRLKLKTSANKSYLFPVGDTRSTDEYSPVTINLTSGANASSYISVNLQNLKDPNNLSTTNYLKRHWHITPSGLTSFSYDININYLNADVTGTESSIYFGKYDDGIWTLLGQPNISTNTFTSTALSNFSTFTGGEAGSLPVGLLSLNCSVSGRNAVLNWSTEWENNNKGFEIQRAGFENGKTGSFEIMGFVAGSENSTELKSYSFTDKNINSGKYRYRIKQTDNNGNSEYFDLNTTVEIGLPAKFKLSQNYPNPFNPVTKIDFEIPADGRVTISVYDLSGKEITKLMNNEFRTAGYHTISFNGQAFSSGVYLYRMAAGDFSVTKKMLMIK